MNNPVLKSIFLLFTLSMSTTVCAESKLWRDYQITPEHPSGYKPSIETDEAGLWMVSDSYEEATKNSPFLIRDEQINQYVRNMVCRIAGEYCPDIRVYILRNAQFNASMFPNGMMHLWTGLLLRVQNEAQLAAIIGHEIAHFLRNHSMQRWQSTRAQAGAAAWVSLISAGAGAGFVGDIFTLGVLANIMSYSRSHESEADAYGIKLLSDAGYDPKQASLVWDYIIREESNAEYRHKGNIFVNSHPSAEGRKKELEKLANEMAKNQAFEPPIIGEQIYQEALAHHYPELLAAELNKQLHGRTETLLKALESRDIGPISIHYFWAIWYRTRSQEGDFDLAIEHYERAIKSERVPAEAYRDLGYLELKRKQIEAAKSYFATYLKLSPDASDREMIYFYLNMDD